MHLFLHLHLLPCCQPLIDLSGLACLDLDALAACTLAFWLGSPGLKLGLSGSFIFNNREAFQLVTSPLLMSSAPSSHNRSPQKHPTHFRPGCVHVQSSPSQLHLGSSEQIGSFKETYYTASATSLTDNIFLQAPFSRTPTKPQKSDEVIAINSQRFSIRNPLPHQ